MKATGLDEYSFDQGALEHPARKPTTIGTNYALERLNGLVDVRVKSENAMKMDPAKLATWSRGLRREIAKAIDDRAVVSPRIKAMTAKQRLEWRRHLQADHVPFRRDCSICTQSAATGKPHRRTEYPQASLALDMAGPFKTFGRDLYEKDYKYLLVGALRVPKEFLPNQDQKKKKDEPREDLDPDEAQGEMEMAEEEELDYEPTESEGEGKGGKSGESPSQSSNPKESMQSLEGASPSQSSNPKESMQSLEGASSLQSVEERKASHLTSSEVETLEHPDQDAQKGGALKDIDEVVFQGDSGVCSSRESGESSGKKEVQEEKKKFDEQIEKLQQPVEYETLYLVRPMRGRRGAETLQAIQEMRLTIMKEGLPLHRLHSDRAREFGTRALRKWSAEVGLIHTKTSGSEPAGNATAEAAVKWTKRTVRALLTSSRASPGDWPLAAQHAAAKKWERRMRPNEPEIPAFGQEVWYKTKSYAGTGEKKAASEGDMPPRWKRASCRGPSGDVTDGHIMARDDGGLVVAKGVRVNLIDPTELEPRLLPELRGSEVKYKPPTRRAKGKTPGVLEEELEPEEGRERNLSPPERYAKECLEKENITQETLEMLMALLPHDELSRDAFSPPDPEMWAPKQWGTGAYVHGGVMGLKKNVKMFKYSTKMMAHWVRTRHPTHQFTSLVLFRNLRTQPHRDSHNDLSSETVVFPISKFQNGEVWAEGEPEKSDEVSCMEKIGDKLVKGKLLPVANRPVTFNPRSWHSTQPWTGDRVVLSAYSIRGSDCLTSEDSDALRELGFALPGDELKYLSSSESSRPSSGAANTVSSSSSKSPEVRVSAIRAVHTFEEQDQEEVKQRRKDAKVAKASIENIYTDNVEELLEKLMTDLQVVHTVRQSEAMKVLMKWKPSMKKEIDALEGKGAILRITKEEADSLEDVEYVHGKCVWTVKPPEHPEEEKGDPDRAKYKRKVRIVACGNQVEDDTLSVQDLYSAGATADIVRTVIAEAGYKRWGAAIDDIRAAFLTAPLPKGARRYILRVPKAVIAAGLAQEGECWLVQTALYGFRQSPKWWTTFRNTRAAEAKFSAEYKGVEVQAR